MKSSILCADWKRTKIRLIRRLHLDTKLSKRLSLSIKRPPHGVVITYLFSYEVNNPSVEYMRLRFSRNRTPEIVSQVLV